MFCKNCGSEISEGANCCIHCGAPVSQEVPTQPQLQQTVSQQPGPMGTVPYTQQVSRYKVNIVALIASVLLAVSMFFPYVSLGGYMKKSLIEGDGVFFMAFAAVGLIGALVKKNIIVVIAGLLATVLSVFEVVNFTSKEYADVLTKEIGFYMMIITSVLLLISGFIKNKR